MSKLMFIGDVHLNSYSPSSRKETNEEYRQVQLDKLKYCYDYAESNNIKNIFYAGDIFNSSVDLLFSMQIEVVKLIKSYDITHYSIRGNHDKYFNNDEQSYKTLLDYWFMTGVLNHLDKVTIDDVTIAGTDYGQNIPEVTTGYNIAVIHAFYENSFMGGEGNNNLTFDKAKSLRYNDYFAGHDHTYYPFLKEETFNVIRPGALMRGTSKTCNLYRNVYFYVFDTETKTWNEQTIPVKEGKDVFNERVFIEKETDINLEKLLSNFSASKGANVYDIIDENAEKGKEKFGDGYKERIELIEKYLESNGIYRRSTCINQ